MTSMPPRREPEHSESLAESLAETLEQVLDRFEPRIRGEARRVMTRLRPTAVLEEADLAASGRMGLIEARRAFDAGRGVPLDVYLMQRVRWAMLDGVRDALCLSRAARQQHAALRGARLDLCAELGREPDQAELARRMGLDEVELEALQQEIMQLLPYQESLPGDELDADGGGRAVPDALVQQSGPEEICAARQLAVQAWQAVEELPATARENLRTYFQRGLTFEEIGRLRGTSKQSVAQSVERGLGKLRDLLTARWGAEVAGEALQTLLAARA